MLFGLSWELQCTTINSDVTVAVPSMCARMGGVLTCTRYCSLCIRNTIPCLRYNSTYKYYSTGTVYKFAIFDQKPHKVLPGAQCEQHRRRELMRNHTATTQSAYNTGDRGPFK